MTARRTRADSARIRRGPPAFTNRSDGMPLRNSVKTGKTQTSSALLHFLAADTEFNVDSKRAFFPIIAVFKLTCWIFCGPIEPAVAHRACFVFISCRKNSAILWLPVPFISSFLSQGEEYEESSPPPGVHPH